MAASSPTHELEPPSTRLSDALLSLVRRPQTTLVAAWSFKAAALSALLRASTFFATNLRSGNRAALHAALVEAFFAIFAAGIMGSVSQRLRNAQPVWATALVISIGMPLLMLLTQRSVHRAANTPHMGIGLTISFCFASVASTFSWYAMRNGALLGGDATTPIAQDARRLPRIILNFILAIPRALFRKP